MNFGPINWPREFLVWLVGNLAWAVVVYLASHVYMRMKGVPAKGAYIALGILVAWGAGWLGWTVTEPIGRERLIPLWNAGRLAIGFFFSGVIWLYVVGIVDNEDLSEGERIPNAHALGVDTKLGQFLFPLKICGAVSFFLLPIALVSRLVYWLSNFF